MVLKYNAESNVSTPLKGTSLNAYVHIFLLLLNHGFIVDFTGIVGRIPVRATAFNILLKVTRQLVSNCCNVSIAMKHVLRTLLAAAYCGNVEVFWEFINL